MSEAQRHWAYYDPSGEIRFVAGLPADAEPEPLDGLQAVEADSLVSGATHYVVDGSVQSYTGEQAEAKRQRPYLLAAWSNTAMAWTDPRTLDDIKAAARAAIDAEAGRARIRYITDVPGQEGVYLRKLTQATAFVAAAGQGDVPPYIAAEAAATGLDPLPAAQAILAIAQQWDDVLSPAIEQHRIGGKRAVDQAADAAAVQTALDAAIAALRSI